MQVTVMSFNMLATVLLLCGLTAVIALPNPLPPDDGGSTGVREQDLVFCKQQSQEVVQCVLADIIRREPRVNITVVANTCHKPVDITFKLKGYRLSWNFTYVPNNQNERISIPDVYMVEPVPRVPISLYVREPEVEYNQRNGSTTDTYITVEASLVAEFNNMWEEEEFLNHTFHLPPSGHCLHPTANTRRLYLPNWVIRTLVIVTVSPLLLACVALVGARYKARQAAGPPQDHLNLVRHTTPPHRDQQGALPETASNNNEATTGETSSTVDHMTAPGFSGEVSPIPAVEINTIQNHDILNRLKKFKNHVEVGLKGITFETLKDENNIDSQSRKIVYRSEHSDGPITSNPKMLSKFNESNNENITEAETSIDGVSNTSAICENVEKLGPKTDSYNNLYSGNDSCSDRTSQTDQEECINKRSDFPGDIPKVEEIKSDFRNNFGYGSRDYLDQLEGATAANSDKNPSNKHASGSHKNKRSKENDHENEKRLGTRSSSADLSKDNHKRGSKMSHEDLQIKSKNLGKCNNEFTGLSGSDVVKEVLRSGVFSYDNEDESSSVRQENGHSQSDKTNEASDTNGLHFSQIGAGSMNGTRPKK